LKGIRTPLLAFLLVLVVFAAVILTRPPAPVKPAPVVIEVTATLPPTATFAAITPAPTVPIQRIDTATLTEAIVGAPKKLNPLLAGFNRADRDIAALIFEGLMTTDNYGAAVPDLAAEVPRVSSDGLTYVFRLRADILWHDGVPFTATDAAFTYRLMQDPAFPGPTDLRAFWQTVEVDQVDDYTLRFTLAQPLAAFLDYLRIGILPEHVLRGTHAAGLATHPFNLMPIGTGPYQFSSWIGSADKITGLNLARAAVYQRRPEGQAGFAFSTVRFKFYSDFNSAVAAFQRGEVISVGELPSDSIAQVSVISQLNIINVYKPAFGAVIYNWENPNTAFFRDIHLRQALTRSVDRAAAVAKALPQRAVVADSPILPNSWAYDKNYSCAATSKFDLASAKQELSRLQMAVPDAPVDAATADPAATAPPPSPTPDPRTPRPTLAPPNPASIRFTLLVRDDPAQVALAQSILSDWAKLGISVQPVVVDTAGYNGRLIAGQFDAALVELNLAPSADPDPYSLWRQVPADGGLNFGRMNDRILSEIVEAARREAANGVHRAELYRQFQRAFCERFAALLVYDPILTYGIDARVGGVQLGFMADLSDRFRTIQDWRFTTP
jgi:peptide/nickel transport system substrate-binding protein